MFCLDPGTVCKPYVQREHIFYSSLPPALQPFIPFFKGCMKVFIIFLKDVRARSAAETHYYYIEADLPK